MHGELKPLRETSLFDVQCKLNNAGASGIFFYSNSFFFHDISG